MSRRNGHRSLFQIARKRRLALRARMRAALARLRAKQSGAASS